MQQNDNYDEVKIVKTNKVDKETIKQKAIMGFWKSKEWAIRAWLLDNSCQKNQMMGHSIATTT